MTIPAATTPGPALFAFAGVSVRFGSSQVLDGVDLAVPADGITAVLGRSGSGKSTLTRLTNRLLDATAGTVSLRGTDVRDLDVLQLRRTVGMVFQRPTLFDGTVRDNLAATHVEDATAHEAMLDAVGLEVAFLDRAVPPSEPMESRYRKAMMAAIATLGLVGLVGLALEFIDPVILSPEHFECVGTSPVLGSVYQS